MPTATRPGWRRAASRDQFGIADRHGAEDDAGDALVEPGVDAGMVADAAAELDGDVDRREDRLDRRAVHRAAGEGAIEIDHVEPLEAGFGEGTGLSRGVRAKDGGARHLALLEADALAVLQVDGGEQDHEESF